MGHLYQFANWGKSLDQISGPPGIVVAVATTANLTMKTYENHVLILNTIFSNIKWNSTNINNKRFIKAKSQIPIALPGHSPVPRACPRALREKVARRPAKVANDEPWLSNGPKHNDHRNIMGTQHV